MAARRARLRVLTTATSTAILCATLSAFHAARANSDVDVYAQVAPVAPVAQIDVQAALVMEIELSTFRLSVRDAHSGERGPTIRVALGSPAQPTPIGRFPLDRIILSPSWRTGRVAERSGAVAQPASLHTPMGAVKIPFAADGVIALHGGSDRRVLGKPISAGCVRATDSDLLRIVAWLDRRDALASARQVRNGEIHRRFRRTIELVVR